MPSRGGEVVLPTLEDGEESEGGREGRHLLLVQDVLLQLQCLSAGCQAQPARAAFCCHHNVNLECCIYREHYSHSAWTPM